MSTNSDNTGFFRKVYRIVEQIPYGKVTTYGAIAEALGSKGAARMVGWALNSSKYNLKNLPAHRVVNRNGLLTGKHHFGGSEVMKTLLENEGLQIEDDRIINFREHFWKPFAKNKL